MIIIDCETDGLNGFVLDSKNPGVMKVIAPNILELSAILARPDDKGEMQILAKWTKVLHWKPTDVTEKKIIEMHTENGLIADCAESTVTVDEARAWWQTQVMSRLNIGEKVCGKNYSGFDNIVLKAWGFNVPRGGRVVDCGALWARPWAEKIDGATDPKETVVYSTDYLCKVFGITPTLHRSLADCEICYELLRRCGPRLVLQNGILPEGCLGAGLMEVVRDTGDLYCPGVEDLNG